MQYATGPHMAHAFFSGAYSVGHVTRMVERVFEGRVAFHSGDAELARGSPCTSSGDTPSGSSRSGSGPGAGGWCSRATRATSTTTSRRARRIPSCTTSRACWRGSRSSARSRPPPTTSSPDTTRRSWSATRRERGGRRGGRSPGCRRQRLSGGGAMDEKVIRPGDVAWSGDNSGIYLKHEPDGGYVTRASYFRVTCSPHGVGNALVLLSGPTRLCLHDNEDLARWLVKDFARHFPQFESSPEMDRLDYVRLDAHSSEGEARSGIRERFRAPGVGVELRWAPAGEAFFIALPPRVPPPAGTRCTRSSSTCGRRARPSTGGRSPARSRSGSCTAGGPRPPSSPSPRPGWIRRIDLIM